MCNRGWSCQASAESLAHYAEPPPTEDRMRVGASVKLSSLLFWAVFSQLTPCRLSEQIFGGVSRISYLCSMDIVDFREFCLSLPEVEECFPFDEVTLVFKVGGKMFAVVGLDNPIGFVVKCAPERAIALRDNYPQVKAAFHFNKKHWNSLRFEGRMSDEQLQQEIRHSYLLVVQQNVTPKARKMEILQRIRQEGITDDAERF